MIRKKKKERITIDEVRGEMLTLFHRLIQRLEKITHDCEDPATINQALKTSSEFLIKLGKEKEQDDDSLNLLLRQTLSGVEGE